MKTKYPSIFGILAIFMLVASLVVPANMASPTTAEAGFDAGICKWDNLEMPDSIVGKWDVLGPNPLGGGSEINKLVVAPDDNTLLSVVLAPDWGNAAVWNTEAASNLMVGAMKGIMWDFNQMLHLKNDMDAKYPGIPAGQHNVFDVACAPDDANFWAVVTSGNQTDVNATWANAPVEVWITEDAGALWECTGLTLATVNDKTGSPLIGCLDISMNYGGKRDIAVGMRAGTGGADFTLWVLQSAGYTGWQNQTVDPDDVTAGGNADIIDLKFSPTYVGDASIAVIFADVVLPGTWFNVALRDLSLNNIASWVYPLSVELCSPATAGTGNSPQATEIITADLELPSDFSGQSASLRRAYVSTYGNQTVAGWDGIFRIDNTTVYVLMDCGNAAVNTIGNIGTIAYYGTYASGKLLAGEVMGYSCTATVSTWFTDSPTTCPIPCWYPALKPTTGAGSAGCTIGAIDDGNAQVAWSVSGELGYVSTSAVQLVVGATWFANFVNAALEVVNDETAFAISRNNSETWNQLGMIDTTITKFTDVAPSADCTTIYLASVSGVPGAASSCLAFDSVWRTSVNPTVTSPLMTLPLSTYYERVYCRVTAPDCTSATQRNYSLLRLAPAPDDEDGEIVFWGVYDPAAVYNSGVAAWSPDFGDYWANVNPRNAIQDFAAASNTLLYFVSQAGMVQGMPYTGTAWSSIEPDAYLTSTAHTIVAYSEEDVLVGADGASTYPGWISNNGGASFTTLFDVLPTNGDVHAAFHPDYADNGAFFLADDAANGTVYRNKHIGGGLLESTWADVDMMAITNTAYGCPDLQAHNVGQFGLQLATTGADNDYALYSAHRQVAGAGATTETVVAVAVSANVTVASATTITIVAGNTIVLTAGAYTTGAIIPVASTAAVGSIASIVSIAGNAGSVGVVNLVGITTGIVFGELDLPSGLFISTGNSLAGAGAIATASGVERTLWPLWGMPKPGIFWDCLNTFVNAPAAGVDFTLEPWSLKKCGCLTVDTDTKLWALDNANYVPATTVGMLWGFADCMAKAGPALITPEDEGLIGCDVVSGRAQEVDLRWEQLCVANAYDIEIGKDANFTIKVIDWCGFTACTGFFAPEVTLAPAAYIPAGGLATYGTASEIATSGNLECGHTYYWKVEVRQCATGQVIRSPWSEVRSFTVKAGLPVQADYYGLKLLAPDNGCIACPVSPASFSWSPFKGTTSYKFILAKDAALTDVLAEAETATTAYEYDGTLDYSTNYFWRVMCVEPAPSDWSATFSFQTEAAPAAPAEAPEAPATPVWVWVIIAMGAILVIVTLVLIFKTRRV